MKTNLDGFKSDAKQEKEGVWFEAADGVRFLVKRFGGMNSPEIKKALAKYHAPYAKLIARNLLPEDKERKIYTKIFVDACLLNWEGVEINGELKEYNRESAIELFAELPELMEMLIEYAQDVVNFSEDVGN